MKTHDIALPFTKLGTPTTFPHTDLDDFLKKMKAAGIQATPARIQMISELFIKKSSRVSRQLVIAKLADCGIENHSSPDEIKQKLKERGVEECSAIAVLMTLIDEPEAFEGISRLIFIMKPASDELGLYPHLFALVKEGTQWLLISFRTAMDVAIPDDTLIVASLKS